MFYYGTQITLIGDILQPLEEGRLFHVIKQPKPAFQDKIRQLRALKTLDAASYRNAKKSLPYLVCSRFHPSVRRKENFVSIQYLIIDLDHLEEAKIDQQNLRHKMKSDQRVLGCFTSPGGDGLKVVFKLDTPCNDSSLFSSFYKLFARNWANEYDVISCLDNQTHDVTRACFLSYDPEVWYYPEAERLKLKAFIPELDFFSVEKEIKEAEKEIRQAQVQVEKKGQDEDVLEKIKSRLNPNARLKPQKNYIIPEEIDKATDLISGQLYEFELTLKSSSPLNYGHKLVIQASGSILWCEINLFYGRKGFSVVLTTKSGSNTNLGEVACLAIKQILEQGNIQ